MEASSGPETTTLSGAPVPAASCSFRPPCPRSLTIQGCFFLFQWPSSHTCPRLRSGSDRLVWRYSNKDRFETKQGRFPRSGLGQGTASRALDRKVCSVKAQHRCHPGELELGPKEGKTGAPVCSKGPPAYANNVRRARLPGALMPRIWVLGWQVSRSGFAGEAMEVVASRTGGAANRYITRTVLWPRFALGCASRTLISYHLFERVAPGLSTQHIYYHHTPANHLPLPPLPGSD